jgi:hypothetical protein
VGLFKKAESGHEVSSVERRHRPDVAPRETALLDKDLDLEVPNDAYVMDEHGQSIRAPDEDDAAGLPSLPKPWVKPAAAALGLIFVGAHRLEFEPVHPGTATAAQADARPGQTRRSTWAS